MRIIFRVFLVQIALLVGSFQAAELDSEKDLIIIENLTPESEVLYDSEKGIWTGRNGVLVTYQDAVMRAQQAVLEEQTGLVRASGAVTLQTPTQIWIGEDIQYNFKTAQIISSAFKTAYPPFYAHGLSLQASPEDKTYSATDAVLTTDDVEEPGYKIRARKLKIVVGKYIEAEDAKVYLGKVPVFFWPKYRRSLHRHPNNLVLTPGYRSLYGPYLLSTYNWQLNTNLSGAVHLDYRQKRGLGLGPDLKWELGRIGQGALQAYYTRDDDPRVDSLQRPITDERYRVGFSHQANLNTNFTVKLVGQQQSDSRVIHDFFETEYRKDPQPKTFVEGYYLWPNLSLDVLAQPRLNDFFQTVERLPDIKLSAYRQQLGVSPFYYEGENSFAYLRFRSIENQGTNFAAMRGDSFHQLTLPKTYFGWLNLTPRVGGRLTHYGETEGRGIDFDEKDRAVFNTGAEASFKASQIWRGARNKFWAVNELRHIIQPTINYVFVPTPNRAPPELPQFDTEIPSVRLLPIDFPDYNAIDSIDSQNVLRLNLRNKLQTKREEGVENLVNWDLYTDWRLKPRPDQGTFADFYSDLDVRPRTWLTFNSELRFDLDNGHWKAANHTITATPGNTWSVQAGHRYFREDPLFGPNSDNNLIFHQVYYRFSENWGFRVSHHFEARDGTLEEQYYTLYRDLRSWTAALTFRVRDNRIGPDDFAVAVTFSLKAFPRFGLGSDRESPSLLLGG